MTRTSRILVVLVLVGLALIAIRGWDEISLITGWGLPSRSSPPMLIIAHRGNMAVWPEDTAEAIWDAAHAGADGIEFDVHQSADGTWWVMHDSTVDATTDGTGSISELSDRDLAGLLVDVGPRDRSTGEIRPPTLASVLDGLADFHGILYIDLQHALVADVPDLVGRLAGFKAFVICRNEDDVRLVHASHSGVGALIRPRKTDSSTEADAFLLESFGEATVARVQAADRPVVTFTDEMYGFLGEGALLRRAWSAGVQAFLSKDLAAALSLRDELAPTDEQ